jgi:hypothetical protein
MLVSAVFGHSVVTLPSAESLGDISSEATDVWSDHGDLVETGHLQNLGDREAVLEPLGEVVCDIDVSQYLERSR